MPRLAIEQFFNAFYQPIAIAFRIPLMLYKSFLLGMPILAMCYGFIEPLWKIVLKIVLNKLLLARIFLTFEDKEVL